MPPKIYLDISTGHLSARTRNLLARLTSAERHDIGWPALTIAAYEYGFFITVPDFGDDDTGERAKEQLPKDLYDALCHGYKSGASTVRFDADGEPVDLPIYED